MAKTVIDFKDYEGDKYETYTGDEPKPGWYTFELQTVGWYGEEKESLRWIFVIADGPYAGWAGFVFGNFDSTKWKNQETARAIQGGAEKPLAVDFDKDSEVKALIKRAKRVRGKVAMNTNPATGETRLSLRKVAPLLEDASTVRKAAPADDLDEIEDAATEAADDEPYTEDELADMKLPELKGILKDEFDFSAADLRKLKTSDAAIDAILDAQEAEVEGDGEADGEGEFDDDFDDSTDGDAAEEEQEPEPEPEPAPRRRRAATATKAAPAKAAAPAQRTRRRRA